jgi:transposase
MLYVGLDIHTKHITVCVLSEAGQVVQRARVRGIEEMLRLLKGLPDRFAVCSEASCGYGHYHDLLQPLAARVLVAHPGQRRLIFRSKSKNDRNDAERLAKLLYLGETPTVHVPSLGVRAWRELINCRSQVIAKRTRAKNALRALLRGAGAVPPKSPGLWTKKGLAWLRQLELPTASQRLRRDLLLEEVEALNGQVRRLEQALQALVDRGQVVDGAKPGAQLLVHAAAQAGRRRGEAVAAAGHALPTDHEQGHGPRHRVGLTLGVEGALGLPKLGLNVGRQLNRQLESPKQGGVFEHLPKIGQLPIPVVDNLAGPAGVLPQQHRAPAEVGFNVNRVWGHEVDDVRGQPSFPTPIFQDQRARGELGRGAGPLARARGLAGR